MTTCGHGADPEDRFCRVCGAPLTAVDQTFIGDGGPASTGSLPAVGLGTIGGVEAGAGVLVMSRGNGAGTSYLLSGDLVTAGREPDSDLFLDDVTVSRRHAEFRRMADGWLLSDVGSLNGTYVNRRRIEEHALEPGDELQIGKYRFVYLVGGDPGNHP